MVSKEKPAILVLREKEAKAGPLAPRVNKEYKANKEYREYKDIQDPKVNKVFLVIMARLEQLVFRV